MHARGCSVPEPPRNARAVRIVLALASRLVEASSNERQARSRLATVMASAARMLEVNDVSEIEEAALYDPSLIADLLRSLEGDLRRLPRMLQDYRTLARAPLRAPCLRWLVVQGSWARLLLGALRCRRSALARRDDYCAASPDCGGEVDSALVGRIAALPEA